MSDWQDEIPRAQFSSFRRIDVGSDWFWAYDIGHGIIALLEPYQFQEVMSFVVKGRDRALLIDTGLGVRPIKPVVDRLWAGPLTVVNTHRHFDHIGGDHEFPQVCVYDHPLMTQRLAAGYPDDHYRRVLADDTFAAAGPIHHIDKTWEPVNCVTVPAGHVFDLGDRQLRLIPAPGHSADSVVLDDWQNHLLFMGDTWYPAVLYSFEGVALTQYADTLDALYRGHPGYTLVCSHNEPYAPCSVLPATAALLRQVDAGQVSGQAQDEGTLYKHDGIRLWVK